METEQKFFVYVDFKEDDGKPFYVGKGSEHRVKDLQRNIVHERIKRKHGMVRRILFETLSEQEAFQKEIQLIQELKTHIDFGEGGANFTLGGEGISGYKYSEEQREARKKKLEDPEYRKKLSELSKKMWEDPEHIEKIKKKYEDPEYKEKMSESLKKLWEDPEHKEKIKKKREDPGYRKKLSEVRKKLWEDPEFKEKMSESCKRKWENPEFKEKMSDAIKQHYNDPEIKKKMSIEAKERNAKLTPEQRSERVKKSWETRKLRKLQQES